LQTFIKGVVKLIVVITRGITATKYVHSILQYCFFFNVNSLHNVVIGDYHCEFRRNSSSTDQIFCIRQILEKNGSIMGQYSVIYRIREGL